MQSVPVISESNLNVHASGENRRQRYSKSGHFNDVVTGVRVRPRDIQIRDIHGCRYGHRVITLIDLTGNRSNIHSVYGNLRLTSEGFITSYNKAYLHTSIVIHADWSTLV